MSYYPKRDGHIRNKNKLELGLSNYDTKKEIEHVTGVDTSNLTTKKYLCLSDLTGSRDIKILSISRDLFFGPDL